MFHDVLRVIVTGALFQALPVRRLSSVMDSGCYVAFVPGNSTSNAARHLLMPPITHTLFYFYWLLKVDSGLRQIYIFLGLQCFTLELLHHSFLLCARGELNPPLSVKTFPPDGKPHRFVYDLQISIKRTATLCLENGTTSAEWMARSWSSRVRR